MPVLSDPRPLTAAEWLVIAADYEREAMLCEARGDTMGAELNRRVAAYGRARSALRVMAPNARPQ